MYKIILLFIISSGFAYSQLNLINTFNTANLPQMADSLLPFAAEHRAVRTVWVTNDLDKDGKQEILVTDYSNNGRVHALELNGNSLEIVWSSPRIPGKQGTGFTPRWVRSGDLDGDGNGEIIFPVSTDLGKGNLYVYEGNGLDNGYDLAITLDASLFNPQGIGDFNTQSEVASVYDLDGDGMDELLMPNRDNNVYVLGLSGDIPGFGGWQIEGGDPSVVPINTGDWQKKAVWHSIPADINGDGKVEIINHIWNFWAFSSVIPRGIDSYSFPDTNNQNYWLQFSLGSGDDALSFMGIQPVDVDGDGNQEIAGIMFQSKYDIGLIDMSPSDTGLYIWKSSKYGRIGSKLWEISGASDGSFWGIGTEDLNQNGREEILLGGFPGYHLVSLEYNGSGSILDPANYTTKILYGGEEPQIHWAYWIRDSVGVVDTVFSPDDEVPFVSKIFAGSDINSNNKKEVILAYQSIWDSISYTHVHWTGNIFVEDSVHWVYNNNQIMLSVLESTPTAVKELGYSIVTPDDYKLEQNYPNPFNPATNFRFTLPVDKRISLKIYDILGNEIKTLINGQGFTAGVYEASWDGTTEFGNSVASGQYICTLHYGNFSKSIKLIVIK